MACRISARNASVVHEIPLLSAVGFDSLSIPLAPSAASLLGVLIPLAPPAGIAALSLPLRPGGTKPPIVLRPAEVGEKEGLFPVGRLHVGGPALGEAKLVALRGPGAPGHIAGSLRQPSAHRFMHAT